MHYPLFTRNLLVLYLLQVFLSLLYSEYPITVIDNRGKKIVIAHPPNRIVVAGTSLYTQIICDLGAQKRLVAVASSSNNPSQLKDLPRVGHVLNPSLETIVALQPDIVIGAFGSVRKFLEQRGIPVITTGDASAGIGNISAIFHTVRTLDFILYGNHKKSDILIQRIVTKLQHIEQQVQKYPAVSVAVIYVASTGTLFAAGKNTPEQDIFQRVRAKNVFWDIQRYKQINIETLLQRNPQAIITDPSQLSFFTTHTILKNLRAIQKGKILGIPASQWISLKVAESCYQVAKFLHPKAFKE